MSQMNPKKCVYNTAISVQPPFTAGQNLGQTSNQFSVGKTSLKNIFAVYKNVR